MKVPPGLTFKGTLPKWPALTRAPDGKFSPPPKPSDCEPAEASFCLTTSSFATTVSNGAPRTTATQVKSTCATVTGCNLRDAEETKSQDACKLTRQDIDSRILAEATGVPEMRALQKRAEPNWSCEKPGSDAIITLKDRTDPDQRSAVKGALDKRDKALKDLCRPHGYHEVRSERLEYTAFFFVNSVGPEFWESLGDIYADDIQAFYRVNSQTSLKKRDEDGDAAKNNTIRSGNEARSLRKRAIAHEQTNQWHLSMLSWDGDYNFVDRWVFPGTGIVHDYEEGTWSSKWDGSRGQGQTIYVMEADWPLLDPAYSNANPREVLPATPWGPPLGDATFDSLNYGYFVASYAVGREVGVASNANLAFVRTGEYGGAVAFERYVEAFMLIADDGTVGNDEGVVNLSFGLSKSFAPHEDIANIWCEVMVKMEKDLGIVFVLAGNYKNRPADALPDKCMPNLGGGLLIGAVDSFGLLKDQTPNWEDSDAFAPGSDLPYPTVEGDDLRPSGTSFAAPLVAGLVANFRALPGSLTDPRSIRSRISNGKRAIEFSDDEDAEEPVLVVWNEQRRVDENPQLDNPNPPPDDDPCFSDGGSSNDRKRNLYSRQSCELPVGGTNPRGPVVSYKPGPPAPLCTANCGKLCNGFFCVPNPTGTPPDFESPAPKSTTSAGNGNTNTNTNTNTGNGGGGFPTLPSTPGTRAPPGEICLSSTTAIECNGGPRGGVCLTSTKCASFGQDPAITSMPPPSTDYISCSHRNQNPGQGIYTAYCVCDGSTFAESLNTDVTPYNSCAYTQKPTSTGLIHTGFAPTTNSDRCQVCTRQSPDQQECTSLANCTPKPTTPPSSPSTRCITGHSYEANCVLPGDGMRVTLWDNGVNVCDVHRNLNQATNNANSVYTFDCGNGRSVTMTRNGRSLTYDAPDGSISLEAYDWQEDRKADICAVGKGSEFEYVFDNGKCGSCPVQKLCNWTDVCRDFDGKCK